MQIKITTQYDIGDILYLQQPNGGGLRKVIIADAIVSMKSRTTEVSLNRRVRLKGLYYSHSEKAIAPAIVYWRRGNIWLTPKPPKKRKPLTEQSYRKWLQETSTNNVRTNDTGEAAYQRWGL